MRLILTLAALAAISAGSTATAGEDKKPSIPEQAGSVGGSIAGTTLGTAVGGPVGGALGSVVGGTVGQTAGKVVHKVMHRKSKKPPVEETPPVTVASAAGSGPAPSVGAHSPEAADEVKPVAAPAESAPPEPKAEPEAAPPPPPRPN